jgi:hypothetical protein
MSVSRIFICGFSSNFSFSTFLSNVFPVFCDIFPFVFIFNSGGGAACFYNPGAVLPRCFILVHLKVVLVGIAKSVHGSFNTVWPFFPEHILG